MAGRIYYGWYPLALRLSESSQPLHRHTKVSDSPQSCVSFSLSLGYIEKHAQFLGEERLWWLLAAGASRPLMRRRQLWLWPWMFLLLVSTTALLSPTRPSHVRRSRADWTHHRGAAASDEEDKVRTGSTSSTSSNNSSNSKDNDDDDNYTLGYSPNFWRHIVRRRHPSCTANNSNQTTTSTTAEVVESFPWWDAAVTAYPHARCLPRPNSAHAPLAGGGVTEGPTYPLPEEEPADKEDNVQQEIRHYLQTRLGWLDSQIDAWLQSCPFVLQWPFATWQERMEFLQAPLMPPTQLAGVVGRVDWPVQFYCHGYGAGLSTAQLSHVLQVFPELLVRDLDTMEAGTKAPPPQQNREIHSNDHNASTDPSHSKNRTNSMGRRSDTASTALSVERLHLLRQLYDETPAVVLQMANVQVPALQAASSDLSAYFAYLHWNGWDFVQIRTVTQALPGILAPTAEDTRDQPWWTPPRHGNGSSNNKASGSAARYLAYRLPLTTPLQWTALCRRYERLPLYRRDRVQTICDSLQDGLQLSSRQLRDDVLVRQPSLFGLSTTGLTERLQFWKHSVGFHRTSDLRTIICAHPALLQYSVKDNLTPQLDFWQHELGWSLTTIRHLTRQHPQLWGRSLIDHWHPLCREGRERCGNLTAVDWGIVLEKAPELALCSWKHSLSVKMDYLMDRLALSPIELGSMVYRNPRILMKSIDSYLRRNIDLLEQRATSKDEVREALLANPSLLLWQPSRLDERLSRLKNLGVKGETKTRTTLSQTLQTRHRSSRAVYLMVGDDNENKNDMVLERFASVAEAAVYAKVSKPYMYQAVREGRLIRGRRYVMAQKGSSTQDTRVARPRKAPIQESSALDAVTSASAKSTPSPGPTHRKLTIYAAARAYPREPTLRRRTGGMALYVPAWKVDDWKKIIPQLLPGQQPYRFLPDSRTLMLGYLYTKASRTRCSLFACQVALRAATIWIQQTQEAPLNATSTTAAGDTDNSNTTTPWEIEIVTDSNRCLNCLENATRLEDWGELNHPGELSVPHAAVYQLNPDILLPLAGFYVKLRALDVVHSVVFAKQRHLELGERAQWAAHLMYNSTTRK